MAVSPSEACSTRSAGSEPQLHTETQSSHSDTSRGGHEHTAQCQAEGWLQLLSRKLLHFNTFLDTFTTEIRKQTHDKNYIICI